MRIVLASANAHKVREIEQLLSGVEVVSLREFPTVQLPEETGETMRENARLKARHCARETGLPSLADDSGIEVEALGGAPGVRSARWIEGSDGDRTLALLEKLKDVPEGDRATNYRCALCLAWPDGQLLETEATCVGRINYQPRGENGFGYDPIFEITAQTGTTNEWVGKTMAQALPEVKAQVSHRARALEKLREMLSSKISL